MEVKNIVEWSQDQLNEDIKQFDQVHEITPDMKQTFEGISRMVMLDRYSFKDTMKKTLKTGDIVVLTVRPDPQYPARGIGVVQAIDHDKGSIVIWVEEEYRASLEDPKEQESGLVTRSIDSVDKPLEIYYEQIAHRNARGLAEVEGDEKVQEAVQEQFYHELANLNFVPAGRVLYGAGSQTEVTYFNCYVMPFIHDSRGGISKHRQEVMEIMSRGGGVGTNGSTLRPHNTVARGVNGKSSGAVSWLNDLATLTHLVEQGGSRRGAQMIMLADWHPDIIEFIISKMQNPNILRFLIENTKDEQIKRLANEKLKFTPFSMQETAVNEAIAELAGREDTLGFSREMIQEAKEKLQTGGTYSVNKPEFLTGANISVTLTNDFMQAVKDNADWELRFPDVENYSPEDMQAYNDHWHEVGDVREWEAMGYKIKTYRTLPARELWQLINICATYSAEPGVFFIDNANADTNAKAYGQKVVATNPCGEQPLAPYSVCNLAAINLAEMADKETHTVDIEKLTHTVQTAIRMQDNVIDSTPYFLPANKKQALGERRIGLGVMGLADLLIYCQVRYGSPESLEIINQVFETICHTAYRTSIELAKTRGSFPFLIGDSVEETQKLRHAFINTGFMKRMPEDIRQDVLTYGIRNSHLLTVAPTGSTGTMIGVSTGLEPYFAFKYYRSGRLGKFIEVNSAIVQEYLQDHPEVDEHALPDFFVSAMELEPEEHVDVQTTIQHWIDSSISKTVNAPKGYTVSQVAKIYERLFDGGAKGGTVYVDGSRDSQVLSLSNEESDDLALFEVEDTRIVTDSKELRMLVESAEADHIKQMGEDGEVIFGSDIGNTCPICRQGIVEEIGGCHTCTNCQAQLRCGL